MSNDVTPPGTNAEAPDSGGDPQKEQRDYQQADTAAEDTADAAPRMSSDPDPDPDADVEPDAPAGLGEPAEHPDPEPGV